MAVPSQVKFKKGGVEFSNSCDRANYYIGELTRAALKDVGKFICRETRKAIKRKTGKLAKNTQYWVRKKEQDCLVGFKAAGWYGSYQELGTEKTPKVGALRNAVDANIDMIQKIEAQYLSAIEDELNAQSLINEEEELGEDEN